MTKDLPRYKRAVATAFGWAHDNKVKAVACATLAVGGGTGLGMTYLGTFVPDQSARDRQYTTLLDDEKQLAAAQKDLEAVTKFQEVQKAGKLTTALDPAHLDKDSARLYQAFMTARDTMTIDFMFARDVSLWDLSNIRLRIKQDVEGDAYETGFDGEPAPGSIRACQKDIMSKPGFSRSANDMRSMQDCVANVSSGEGLMLGIKLSLAFMLIGGGYATARTWHREAAAQDTAKAAASQAAPSANAMPLPLALAAPTKVSPPLKLKLKPRTPAA